MLKAVTPVPGLWYVIGYIDREPQVGLCTQISSDNEEDEFLVPGCNHCHKPFEYETIDGREQLIGELSKLAVPALPSRFLGTRIDE